MHVRTCIYMAYTFISSCSFGFLWRAPPVAKFLLCPHVRKHFAEFPGLLVTYHRSVCLKSGTQKSYCSKPNFPIRITILWDIVGILRQNHIVPYRWVVEFLLFDGVKCKFLLDNSPLLQVYQVFFMIQSKRFQSPFFCWFRSQFYGALKHHFVWACRQSLGAHEPGGRAGSG